MDDTLRYRVEGMDCAACAQKIESALGRIEGVGDITVSTAAQTLRLRAPEGAQARIEDAVRGLGYGIAPLSASVPPPEDPAWWRTPKALLALASAAGLLAAFLLAHLVPGSETVAYTAATLVGLVPVARRAVSAARAGSPWTIETLMTIAAVGAVVIGETEEAAIVVLLFLVGELLEGIAAGRARAGIRALAALVPKTALLERDGRLVTVEAVALLPGDVILVRPGDRIPADGTVLSGESAVDEAPVTGESVPRPKMPGDGVFAGTIAVDASMRVRVTADAQDNTLARVVRLVEEAQEAKAPTARFIDRFARIYTPGVLLLGLLVATLPPLVAGADWLEWIYRGLAVLLIGCPCALVISTPAAIAAGLAAGARRGLLIKGGAVLERLGRVDAVAFDKTGTLTRGRPVVTDVIGFDATPTEVLEDAASLGAGSSHPIVKAILAHAEADGIAVTPAIGIVALGGKGVKGRARRRALFLGSPVAAAAIAPLDPEVEARIVALQDDGKSVSVLVVGARATGLIAVRDEPREDAAEGLRALERLGIAPVMLTGDNAKAASIVADRLGIPVHAELLPQDKMRLVDAMKAQGRIVAKVGDGINDAPALAAADVGIAMGGGTDVALETGDAAILDARVRDVARMVRLSRDTLANIRQNIAVALGLKALFLATTILGVTGLWPAILADTGATVLVTLNAMRLLGAGRAA